MSYLLTIVIPTYNRRDYLERCVNHILSQNVKFNDSIEFIIMDNHSTDNTEEYCNELINKYNFIQYIRHDHNIGPDMNFLTALKTASGKYVHIVSDDDYMIDGALANEYDFLNVNELDFAYANLLHFSVKRPGEFYNRLMRFDDNRVIESKNELITTIKNEITFLSGIIYRKANFDAIDNPEQYNNTNWLQSYLAFASMAASNVKIGMIGMPTIAVNDEVKLPGYNLYKVFGVNQKRLYQFAYKKCGFGKKPLMKNYKSRVKTFKRYILIQKREHVKGIFRDFYPYFKISWYNPILWLSTYPMLFVPGWLVRFVYKIVKGR